MSQRLLKSEPVVTAEALTDYFGTTLFVSNSYPHPYLGSYYPGGLINNKLNTDEGRCPIDNPSENSSCCLLLKPHYARIGIFCY